MRKLLLGLAIAALPFSALAEEESQARSWGLLGEQAAVFEAKVVDIMCEVTGTCAEACGAGNYQLGLLTNDGKLIPVNKNGQTSFNGGVEDLLPHCGKTIKVDGLFVGEDIPSQLFQVQLLKPEGAEEWQKANLHTKKWAEKFPDSAGSGPWFRRDPRILAIIEESGYMGLGLEEDAEFIQEWYGE